MQNLIKKLNLMFLICAVLSLLEYISIFVFHKLGFTPNVTGDDLRNMGLIFFILSVTSGIALPIIFRTLLHGKLIANKRIKLSEYLRYNIYLFILAYISVVFSSVNYFLAAPPLYLYGSVLAALWGIYGVMPGKKRISTETKYYRVNIN